MSMEIEEIFPSFPDNSLFNSFVGDMVVGLSLNNFPVLGYASHVSCVVGIHLFCFI